LKNNEFLGKVTESVTGLRCQNREPGVSYMVDFGAKNDDIGDENGFFWNNNVETSM
jgi:hypothetical protein